MPLTTHTSHVMYFSDPYTGSLLYPLPDSTRHVVRSLPDIERLLIPNMTDNPITIRTHLPQTPGAYVGPPPNESLDASGAQMVIYSKSHGSRLYCK